MAEFWLAFKNCKKSSRNAYLASNLKRVGIYRLEVGIYAFSWLFQCLAAAICDAGFWQEKRQKTYGNSDFSSVPRLPTEKVTRSSRVGCIGELSLKYASRCCLGWVSIPGNLSSFDRLIFKAWSKMTCQSSSFFRSCFRFSLVRLHCPPFEHPPSAFLYNAYDPKIFGNQSNCFRAPLAERPTIRHSATPIGENSP
jgi:hypothetical protein